MGFGDKIRGAVEDAIGATPINAALGSTSSPSGVNTGQTGDFPKRTEQPGHVTSGMDRAMRAQADKLHPVSKPAPAVYGADWDK